MATWSEHMTAWSNPPVDDVGYVPSSEMLRWSTPKLSRAINDMRRARYTGWRNHGNRWRDVMGLDELTDRDVLDFGCGVGVEALELARAGNRVALADITTANTDLATRVLATFNEYHTHSYLIGDVYPFVGALNESFDVFYCNGVLHHCRWPRAIMERAHELLPPNGEVRLMVYSDVGWRVATSTEPPDDVESHPEFTRFVQFFDAVGDYADWYNRERVVARFGDLFDVDRCEYLTPDDRYLGVVLRKRS